MWGNGQVGQELSCLVVSIRQQVSLLVISVPRIAIGGMLSNKIAAGALPLISLIITYGGFYCPKSEVSQQKKKHICQDFSSLFKIVFYFGEKCLGDVMYDINSYYHYYHYYKTQILASSVIFLGKKMTENYF